MRTNTFKSSICFFFIILTVLLTSAIGFADTEVRGTISQNTQWTADKSPYLATGSLIVKQGVTLTIDPGVTVKFNPNTAFQVDGTFVARGTKEKPITFTPAQGANPGGWGYILFTDKSTPSKLDDAGNYIEGSTLEYATIEYAGGVQDIGAALRTNVSNLLIDHCTIRNSAAIGVFVDAGKGAVIRNSTIRDNKNYGISGSTSLKVAITNNTITGNTGGGITVGGTATITNNTITGNTAPDRGGGIYVGGTATITNNTITGNTAPDGGGITVGGTATITNNAITGNTASSYNGGIAVYGTATIANNTITGNTASSYNGGIGVGGTVIVTNNIITRNTASYNGGIGVSGGTATISNNTITENTASSGGGIGIIFGNPTATITNNVITGNTASQGSATFLEGNIQDFSSNTVVDNKASGTAKNTSAIYISRLVPKQFKKNAIYNNQTAFDLYYDIPKGTDMDATENYWGTADEAKIGLRIYDFFANASKGIVNFVPFLTAPPGGPLPIPHLLVVEGVIRNPDGSPAAGGLNVTVTLGGNSFQTTLTENDGTYAVTYLNPLGPVAKSGDTVEVRSSMAGGSAVNTVILTAQQIAAQKVTIDVRFGGQPSFDLSFPTGIGLVHIPLKVTEVGNQARALKTISDLYDALGPGNVNFIITRDASAGVWLSYLGPHSRGTAADRTLTDDLGIISVMKAPVTLRLTGDALGSGGKAQMNLQRGTNLLGVPLRSATLKRVSDLLSLEGFKGNATSIIVSDGGEFKVVAKPGDPGDIPITGGQSFIIVARQAGVAEITGVAWDNASGGASAAPPMMAVGPPVDDSTPVLAVYGAVMGAKRELPTDDIHITVKNLSTGAAFRTLSGGNTPGSYSVTFVDAISSRAAQVGDVLEITAESSNPLIDVQPLRHIVSTDDVVASQIQLPNLIVYEIPQETRLLPNYPNPFNPETWMPYQLNEASEVTMTVYDSLGRAVKRLDLGYQPAGIYRERARAAYWDGRNDIGEPVASGVYFLELRTKKYQQTQRMVLLK